LKNKHFSANLPIHHKIGHKGGQSAVAEQARQPWVKLLRKSLLMRRRCKGLAGDGLAPLDTKV
jgi:hypothetical protein